MESTDRTEANMATSIETTIAVPADKIRAGDVVSLCQGFEPDTVIASAEYYGWRNGLNCVQIAFEGEDGPYFLHTSGWRANGIFAPETPFYVSPSAVDAIRARPTAMDEFYGEV